MRGFINFYVNIFPDSDLDHDTMISIFKNQNKELVESLRKDGYEIVFVPCVKEGTRVEKIDLDQPWPPIYPVPVCKVEKHDNDEDEDGDKC